MSRVLLIAFAMLVVGCSDASEPTTAAPALEQSSTTAPPPATTTTDVEGATSVAPSSTTTTSAAPVVPAQLAESAIEAIRLDGAELLVAIADSSDLRRQGLMEVDDLKDLDGMLFVFDRDTSSGLWMKNTVIPLDIAFFDVDGVFGDGFELEACTTADCPTYRPSGSYRIALEMPAGQMPDNVQLLER